MHALQTSTATAHTPGPYDYHRSSDGVDDLWIIESVTTEQTVAVITFWDCSDEWANRALADARLLTAAPELFDALKQVLAVIGDIPGGLSVTAYEAEQLALAAVAKAEGSSES